MVGIVCAYADSTAVNITATATSKRILFTMSNSFGLPGAQSSLGIVAGAGGRAALFPKLFPIPEAVHYGFRQRVADLVGEHQHLAAMVGFVGEHVAQHFWANGPRASPAVSDKLFDAAVGGVEGFREHLLTADGARRQSCAGLAQCTVGALQLPRNFQMRNRQPDPLGADVV